MPGLQELAPRRPDTATMLEEWVNRAIQTRGGVDWSAIRQFLVLPPPDRPPTGSVSALVPADVTTGICRPHCCPYASLRLHIAAPIMMMNDTCCASPTMVSPDVRQSTTCALRSHESMRYIRAGPGWYFNLLGCFLCHSNCVTFQRSEDLWRCH